MLLSAADLKTYQQKMNGIAAPLRTKMMNVTVKLTGNSPVAGEFVATGAILYAREGVTTIATAKHSLFKLYNVVDQPEWDEKYVNGFRERIQIRYDTNMQYDKNPQQVAPIAGIESIIPDEDRPWEYDVMILTSNDANLAAFAEANYVYDDKSTGVNMAYLLAANRYLQRQDQTFIQFGYGASTETAKNGAVMPTKNRGSNNAGRLQYRFPDPLAQVTATVYGQRDDNKARYDAMTDAIQITGSESSSSAPGDSGGPLFVVQRLRSGDRLFLIGVTLGADHALAPAPCPRSGSKLLRENNISISLEYCYQNGHLLC